MKKLLFILFLLPNVAFGAIENCETLKTVPNDRLSLPEIIDLGLCRNPRTAYSYLAYESARFAKNAGYSNYLPHVDASVHAGVPYHNEKWEDWTGDASLSASYLIFDFGKRWSDVKELTASWRAAGFEYDGEVQNYIYGLIGAYYSLLTADADVTSATSLLKVAQTAKNTADKKYKAGVVAHADVLKADTTLASRVLELERAKNGREIIKGKLLSMLSFPADQDLKIRDMPFDAKGISENNSIEELINLARKKRPELLRATANKNAAWHRRNSMFLKNLPSISANGSLDWNTSPIQTFPGVNNRLSGTIGIRASMPIFTGLYNFYNVRQAQANYEGAIEQERESQDSVTLDIFTAYENYKTARTLLKQTQTLLASAKESERVVAGMYKVGRATMLDWQTAQSDLVDAQKQHNAAKYDLFTKRAAVALAVGEISAELLKEQKTNED